MFHCSRQSDANRKLRLIYKSGEMSLKITAKVSPEKRGKRCEKCLPSQHANRGERGHFTYNVCTEGAGKAADGPQECNCDKVNVRNIADVIHVCGWPQAHSMPPTTKAQSHSLVRLAVNVPAQSKTQARTRPRYSGTIRKSDIAAAAVAVAVGEKEFWFSPSSSRFRPQRSIFAYVLTEQGVQMSSFQMDVNI